jgi:hypothetical protein
MQFTGCDLPVQRSHSPENAGNKLTGLDNGQLDA